VVAHDDPLAAVLERQLRVCGALHALDHERELRAALDPCQVRPVERCVDVRARRPVRPSALSTPVATGTLTSRCPRRACRCSLCAP
jgi:hypothetical protein